MSKPRIGGLFEGYGGLTTGVTDVLGGELAWYSEIDKGACKVLRHHFPDVPNVGDVTTADWSQVEPVDILTGGSPCQDLSHAGARKGMTEGTRSNLWVAMREAIAQLRPSLVIWENVRGAYSADADSDLEFCPGCMGARRPGTVLRALGRVLGDLSDLGYDARWHGLRAADVGAPHGRFRVFVVAYPQGDTGWVEHGDGGAAPDAIRGGCNGWSRLAGREAVGRVAAQGTGADALLPNPRTSDTNGAGAHGDGGMDLRTAVTMLPTPRATDGTKGGPNQRGSSGDLMLPSAVSLLGTPTARDHKGTGPVGSSSYDWMLKHGSVEAQILSLLPTPAVNDMGEGKTPDAWDEWTAKMQAKHGNGNGHGASLSIEAQRLLPTPTTEPDTGNGHARNLGREVRPDQWGIYADAIHRWEALTRPAPPPTETGPKGNPRLSAAFSEWMMGLLDGWVTGVPGITRNEALKAIGNGVVPQQCAAALRLMLVAERAA